MYTYGGMALTNYALGYLNYATRIVFKSAKIIPVMAFSVIIVGKKYALKAGPRNHLLRLFLSSAFLLLRFLFSSSSPFLLPLSTSSPFLLLRLLLLHILNTLSLILSEVNHCTMYSRVRTPLDSTRCPEWHSANTESVPELV